MVETTFREVLIMLIKEVAEKTGIGESTIRFYMNKFPEFMFYKIEGRRKKYSSEVVEIIKFISDKYSDQWTAEQIREELGRKHSILIEVDVKKEKEENSSVLIPGDQDFISTLVAQNSMLIEKILSFEHRIVGMEKAQHENAVEQQKNAAELKADYQRLSNELNAELHSVLAEERVQYQSRIQELESQVKEQQNLIIERLEVREKAIQEAITAWREAAATTREEKKPWWKFWA